MSEKKTFVTSDDVETQVFDWGRLSWLSEPLVTAAERFSCGVVTLEPGKGHVRHNHPYSEEVLYVIEGRGIQTVELASGKLEKEIELAKARFEAARKNDDARAAMKDVERIISLIGDSAKADHQRYVTIRDVMLR